MIAKKRDLFNPRDVWLRTDVSASIVLLADAALVTGAMSMEFLFLAGLTMVPLFLSLFLLKESRHLMGRRFLKAWRTLTLLLSYFLMAFGVIFFLHFQEQAMVAGIISVIFGIVHRFYVMHTHRKIYLQVLKKEIEDRRRLDALRQRGKPEIREELKKREREFYQKMVRRLREEGVDVGDVEEDVK